MKNVEKGPSTKQSRVRGGDGGFLAKQTRMAALTAAFVPFSRHVGDDHFGDPGGEKRDVDELVLLQSSSSSRVIKPNGDLGSMLPATNATEKLEDRDYHQEINRV